MSGLTLKLAPKERLLINGALIENGQRRSCFSIVTPNSKVLRLKDAIHPNAVETPLGRICYDIQLLLTGDSGRGNENAMIVAAIDNLASILGDVRSQQVFQDTKLALADDKPYTALKLIKQLLPLEKHLLAMRPERVANTSELHICHI